MRVARCFFSFLLLFALALCCCKSAAPVSSPKPLTVIQGAAGEIIEYGVATGATTLPAAMANVWSQMHQACGEKPSVGQVFRVKQTSSAGVFLTVMDHAQNRQLSGMVIAEQGGPSGMEAAAVSDTADKCADDEPDAAAIICLTSRWSQTVRPARTRPSGTRSRMKWRRRIRVRTRL